VRRRAPRRRAELDIISTVTEYPRSPLLPLAPAGLRRGVTPCRRSGLPCPAFPGRIPVPAIFARAGGLDIHCGGDRLGLDSGSKRRMSILHILAPFDGVVRCPRLDEVPDPGICGTHARATGFHRPYHRNPRRTLLVRDRQPSGERTCRVEPHLSEAVRRIGSRRPRDSSPFSCRARFRARVVAVGQGSCPRGALSYDPTLSAHSSSLSCAPPAARVS